MKRWTKIVAGIIIVCILALCGIGIYRYGVTEENMQPEFLLTLISTVGALGGIIFAIYGWYSVNEIPKMVDEEVKKQIHTIREEIRIMKKEVNNEFYRQQEAMQKMNAVYAIKDANRKIELLHDILQLYPKTYNAYVTLAYTYWYDKKDLNSAEESFLKELDQHPNNYQAMCDLVALYSSLEEWRSALKWMKKAVEINEDTKESFKTDSRLTGLKSNKTKEFTDIVKS